MRKRVQIALAVLLVAVVGVIAWEVLRLREPVYQGKRLSFWLQSYSADGDSPEVDEALLTIALKLRNIPTARKPEERSPMRNDLARGACVAAGLEKFLLFLQGRGRWRRPCNNYR